MNLAVIERMPRTGDMSFDAAQYLVRCRAECECSLTKVILHLENDKQSLRFYARRDRDKKYRWRIHNGRCRRQTWELVRSSRQRLYDTKQLRDKIRKCSGLELDVDIVHHEVSQFSMKPPHRPNLCPRLAKRENGRTGTVVASDFAPKEPFGLHRGEIYFRKGDSTVRIELSPNWRVCWMIWKVQRTMRHVGSKTQGLFSRSRAV